MWCSSFHGKGECADPDTGEFDDPEPRLRSHSLAEDAHELADLRLRLDRLWQFMPFRPPRRRQPVSNVIDVSAPDVIPVLVQQRVRLQGICTIRTNVEHAFPRQGAHVAER